MEIVSASPLRVSSVLWQKAPAAWVLTVVCKATFDLLPGECQLAADQEAPNEADNHWDDDLTRSVHAPGDLAPVKLRADVVVVGPAFSHGGAAVRSLIARLMVGKIDKSIEVFGERALGRDGSIQEGARWWWRWRPRGRPCRGPTWSAPSGLRRLRSSRPRR
jgi:hypothetical protein